MAGGLSVANQPKGVMAIWRIGVAGGGSVVYGYQRQ